MSPQRSARLSAAPRRERSRGWICAPTLVARTEVARLAASSKSPLRAVRCRFAPSAANSSAQPASDALRCAGDEHRLSSEIQFHRVSPGKDCSFLRSAPRPYRTLRQVRPSDRGTATLCRRCGVCRRVPIRGDVAMSCMRTRPPRSRATGPAAPSPTAGSSCSGRNRLPWAPSQCPRVPRAPRRSRSRPLPSNSFACPADIASNPALTGPYGWNFAAQHGEEAGGDVDDTPPSPARAVRRSQRGSCTTPRRDSLQRTDPMSRE